MKIIVITILSLLVSFHMKAQECEERETRLVQGLTSFSAALLYNTYGVIGSLSDAYGNDVYDAKTMNNLLNAQKKLIENLSIVMEDMSRLKILRSAHDLSYATAYVSVLNGLKIQAELMLDYIKSKTPQRLEVYETQRKKNWTDISRLMGLDE